MCSIAGISFYTPVWNAPIPLSDLDIDQLLRCSQTGALVTKTITRQPKKGNPNDWRLHPWGSENNIALHNDGIVASISRLQSFALNKPVFFSLAGHYDEIVEMIEMIHAAKFSVPILIEWNISCPNVPDHPNPTAEQLQALKVFGLPIGLKTSLQIDPDLPILRQADFVTAINSIGGKAGRCIRDQAVQTVRLLSQRLSCPIIGCGGIETSQDINLFLQAGATAVEIGTGFLRHGIGVFPSFNPRYRLINDLHRHDIIKKGTFVLKNGQISTTYIDIRSAISIPTLFNRIINQAVDFLQTIPFDCVCGVPYGGLPLAAVISAVMNKPLLICRDNAKDHGLKRQLEGEYRSGWICLVIEDVVTTGTSAESIARVLQQNNLIVNNIFCLVNRNIASNRRIISLWTMAQVQNPLPTIPFAHPQFDLLRQISQQKNTRLCYAADSCEPGKLLSFIDQIGPYICLLKIHPEMLMYTEDLFQSLQNLQIKHQFAILLDRKFADIPATVLRQFTALAQRYPCNFVTSHITMGEWSIRLLSQRLGVFVLAQSSSYPEISATQVQLAVQWAEQNNCGLVSRERLHPELPHLVAGVNLSQRSDQLGQQYLPPEQVQFADYVVVGRGITSVDEARMYQEHFPFRKPS